MARPRSSDVRFPAVSGLVAPLLKAQDIPLNELAELIKLSPSALSSYAVGRRAPEKEALKKLSEFFYTKEAERNKFKEQMAKAAKQGIRSRLGHWDAILEDREAIQVGTIAYGMFSGGKPFGGAPAFLDELLQRFLVFSGIRRQELTQVTVDGAIEGLAQETLDVVLGMLATPERKLKMRLLYKTPIRIGLGAVKMRGGPSSEEVQQLLSVDYSGDRSERICPVVFRNEIGNNYITRSLQIRPDLGDVEVIDPRPFESLQDHLERRDDRDRARVLVCDAYTAIRFQKAHGINMELVFGLDRDDPIGNMPAYPLAIAGNRADENLWIHFIEALELYLESDFYEVCRMYRRLYDKLLLETKSEAWVKRTLGWDAEFSTTDRLWHEIIKGSRIATVK